MKRRIRSCLCQQSLKISIMLLKIILKKSTSLNCFINRKTIKSFELLRHGKQRVGPFAYITSFYTICPQCKIKLIPQLQSSRIQLDLITLSHKITTSISLLLCWMKFVCCGLLFFCAVGIHIGMIQLIHT